MAATRRFGSFLLRPYHSFIGADAGLVGWLAARAGATLGLPDQVNAVGGLTSSLDSTIITICFGMPTKGNPCGNRRRSAAGTYGPSSGMGAGKVTLARCTGFGV